MRPYMKEVGAIRSELPFGVGALRVGRARSSYTDEGRHRRRVSAFRMARIDAHGGPSLVFLVQRAMDAVIDAPFISAVEDERVRFGTLGRGSAMDVGRADDGDVVGVHFGSARERAG